ncbi:hypothetical protein Micbo1qcDRAFT_218455 [Microdochium bolleyi]|uniref:Uncharacterized protein n=1 Tax=Microdochium bolleyi TaxID=196109 RepID=A0A136IQF7_9PEZI|nr:hypothetical protein Micbo1qcDRAFT_218455 [Microdochium bolleyi]
MAATQAHSSPACGDAIPEHHGKVLFSFNPAIAIENVALTSSGALLLTTLYDGGRLYALDPTEAKPAAKLVATMPGCDGLTGIQEIAPDVFAVTGGPLGPTGFEGLKSFNVSISSSGHQPVTVAETASVPGSAMLNGMAKLANDPTIILGADSFRGEIIRMNTITGETAVAIQDDLFKPTASLSLGINGLKVLRDYLYFTNSAQGILARLRIHSDGTKASEVEVLATLPGTPSRSNFFDDFAIRETHTDRVEVYVATQANSVYRVYDGQLSLFLGGGNSTLLKVPTSAAFSHDGSKLFVVTGGGQVVEVAL